MSDALVLLADVVGRGTIGSLAWYIIAALVLFAIIAIAGIVLKNAGIQVPPDVARIGWIVLLVGLGVLAIVFLVSLL